MYIVQSYPVAVILCVITMLCWGSWANTQKLATKNWAFPLFYWDYTLGVLLFSLLFGLTLGSSGDSGQGFLANLADADTAALGSAFLGGVVFNFANLLLVAAIDLAGMAIAFPIGIGLALVLGVLVNYLATPVGNAVFLFTGVALVSVAIILDAIAYKKISKGSATSRGILISLLAGILMGFFFRFVAASMSPDNQVIAPGMLTPYSALFVFAIGVFLSSFLFNSYFMYRPMNGSVVTFRDYFSLGDLRLHTIGILGGIIWCIGMSLSLIASEKAGYAISYGLGQGATLIAAIWGVFIWKEFKHAPPGTDRLLTLMFVCFIIGLTCIIYSRYA
ncbi:MAG: multidrug DMT transporter permease [Saprospiraceae bacterium]|nr:multidrug DMT transporter permease [Saprospiraceae bacterium]MCB9320137.1 multidrug DMT transporter permease [Lewinellaceae bacterium]